MTRRIPFALAGVAAAALAALAPAQRPAAPPILSGKEIYQKCLKSTALILRLEGDRMAQGSGSLIDVPGRLVLTNYHVVGSADQVIVFFPAFDKQGHLIAEREYYADQLRKELRKDKGGVVGKVIAREPRCDLAVVKLDKLPSGTPAVRLAKDSVGPGDTVHSIGNPGLSGALWVYTPGSVKTTYKRSIPVAGSRRELPFEVNARIVETTSPVNPGDSGGPVFNSAGELAAVTQGMMSEEAARSISIFIDVGEVRQFLTKHNIRITNAPAAAEVTTASAEMPAAKADPKAAAAAAKDAEKAEQEKKEKDAERKLSFAKDFVKDRPEKARERLEDIVKNYPGTRAAKEAKDLLGTLKK